MVLEIAYHEALGKPLNLKRLFLLETGSPRTVQRRLLRLTRVGVVEQRRSGVDRRVVEIRLTPRFRNTYGEYGAMLSGDAVLLGRPRHKSRRRNVFAKTVRRACTVVGGVNALAERIGVRPDAVHAWLGGEEPSMEAFLACVDIALTALESAEPSKK